LNLCFYHDGILPPVGESVNFAAELAQCRPAGAAAARPIPAPRDRRDP
jgi:hypothetical protein